jgi:hypothetical protein
MTVAKRRSSTDDKVEAKRKIIRKSLDEITAEVQRELRCADLRSSISMVVPSRYSIVSIAGPHSVPPDDWSRMSEIARRVVARRLGGSQFRGRPLAHAVATAVIDVADVSQE